MGLGHGSQIATTYIDLRKTRERVRANISPLRHDALSLYVVPVCNLWRSLAPRCAPLGSSVTFGQPFLLLPDKSMRQVTANMVNAELKRKEEYQQKSELSATYYIVPKSNLEPPLLDATKRDELLAKFAVNPSLLEDRSLALAYVRPQSLTINRSAFLVRAFPMCIRQHMP